MNALTPKTVPTRRSWADASVAIVLALIAVTGFTPAFGDGHFLGAAIGGLLVGAAAAAIAALYRMGTLLTALVAVAAYFVFGSALAMPSVATFGFIPNGQTLTGLTTGAVFGWSDIVTLRVPVDAPDYVTVVPYLAAWVVAVVDVTLALRWLPRRPSASAARGAVLLVGPTALYLAGILLGTHDAFLAAVRGVGFAAIALIWLGWRERRRADATLSSGTGVLRRKILGIVALIAVAALGGSFIGFSFRAEAQSRFVLREHVSPPFDPLSYPSPLAGYRQYSVVGVDQTILTVSGVTKGQLIRLAALDSYDGVLWSVTGAEQAKDGSGQYSLVGDTPPAPDIAHPTHSAITVKIADYSSVWLPSSGYVTSVHFRGADSSDLAAGLRYNTISGTGIETAGLHKGDSYELTAENPVLPSNASLEHDGPASLQLPPATTVQVVSAEATKLAGKATTPIDKLRAIEKALKSQGYLRHGLASEDPPSSAAGHGAARLIDLFSGPYMVGDQEQFASAFALMARNLGYPSRVVMGFAAPASGTVAIKGKNVTAWAEVAFDKAGWVPFYPTPTKVTVPQSDVPVPQSKPQPQVRQPPRAIENPEDLFSPNETKDKKPKDHSVFSIPGWAIAVGGSVGIPLVLVGGSVLLISVAKRRRRARRRSRGLASTRIAAGWDEFVDGYGEFGYPIPRLLTRAQLATVIANSAELPTGGVATLAKTADRAVFSGREDAEADVDDYWASAIAELERLAAGTPRWRRILNRFALRRTRRRVDRPTKGMSPQ